MSVAIRRMGLLAIVAIILPVAASAQQKKDDPPKKTDPPAKSPVYRNAGKIAGEVSKVMASSVTLSLPEIEPAKSGRGRGKIAYKDHDFTFADDVKVRWKDLPKGPDGKPKQYTNAEYQKLLQPLGTPGFKAELSDLHAGQTVQLFLSKAGKDDPPIVTIVLVLGEASKPTTPAKGKDGKSKGGGTP